MRIVRAALYTLAAVLGGASAAGPLRYDVEIQHVGGTFDAKEVRAMLESPQLYVEAMYAPAPFARRGRLIVIKRRVRLPAGQLTLGPGLALSAVVPAPGWNEELARVYLVLPVPAGLGRLPSAEIELPAREAEEGPRQWGLPVHKGTLELGLRVRARAVGSTADWQRVPPACGSGVVTIDDDRYSFATRHPLAGALPHLRSLAANAADGPHRYFTLARARPPDLNGWDLNRNHLVQLRDHGAVLEAVSLYATRGQVQQCWASRQLDAVWVDGRLVALGSRTTQDPCSGQPGGGEALEARWDAQGKLEYLSRQPGPTWEASATRQPAGCGQQPPHDQAEALVAPVVEQAQRLRQVFLRNGPAN